MTVNGRNADIGPEGAERDPRLDRVYRAAGGEVPPTHLDAAILGAAHREVGSRPRSVPAALRRWRVPVSIAAVVVLSVSVVMLVREEGGEKLMQAELRRPPLALPREVTPPPLPKPEQADAQPALSPAPAPATAPAPSRLASRGDAPARAPAELGMIAGRERAEAVAPASEGAGTAAMPEPSAKSALSPPSVAVGRSAEPPASGPAPEPDRARAMARTAERASARSDRLPIWRGFENEPPQKWLERIEELKRQERAAEAADMLAEFKRRFPGHPVPPGLQ